MNSRIDKREWFLLYAVAGIVDIAQIIFDLTGIGLVLSQAIDIVMGFGLLFYFQKNGVSIIRHPARLASLLGIFGLETITGGIAPAWIVDIWYIHRTVKQDESAQNSQDEEANMLMSNIRQPLYSDGMRLPRNTNSDQKPPVLNVDGIRPPNGGLK